MTLGDKIYNLRQEKGLSQNELADLLDVSRQSVSKWEIGASVPDIDKLIKLSEIFSVSIDSLVKDSEEISSSSPEYPEEANNGNAEANTETKAETTKAEAKAETKAEEKAEARPPLYTAGIALLCTSLVLFVILSFFGGVLSALILVFPIVICAILCMKLKKRAGLACFWVIYTAIFSYLNFATGLQSIKGIILMLYHGILENIYRSILILIPLAITELALIIATVYSFRKTRIALCKKTYILSALGAVFAIGMPFLLSKMISPDIAMGEMAAFQICSLIIDRSSLAIFLALIITYLPHLFDKSKKK